MKALLLALVLASSASLAAPSPDHPPPMALAPSGEAPARPSGEIASAVPVADPVFGVHANVLGLERRVEMLQWRRVDTPAPPHYEQAWTTELVASEAFDDAHRNPDELPFNGAAWWTTEPKLDGHAVGASVLSALDAWTPLQPDLSQLPTNLAVSFQPDGDWLSTSQDPAHPHVGDVRVRWRAIAHAPAPSGATLVAGKWELPAPASAPAPPSSLSLAETPEEADEIRSRLMAYLAWWLIGGGILALLVLLLRRRRHRRR